MHAILDARNLSEVEQNMLRAAVGNQGVLEIVSGTTTHGRAVVAGRTKFFSIRMIGQRLPRGSRCS